MKDEKIIEVIEAANGRGAIHIFQHVRIGNITTAKVVFPPLDDEPSDPRSSDFFLIFEGESKCVGAVYDMGKCNLHVYVQPEYRRRGLMTAALKDVVLPYLFYRGRTEQRVTFSDEGVGRMNEKVGFQRDREGKAVAYSQNFPAFDPARCVDFPIAVERMTTLQKQVAAVVGDLRWIGGWIAPGPNDDVPRKLKHFQEAADALANHIADRAASTGNPLGFQANRPDDEFARPSPPLCAREFRGVVRNCLKETARKLFWVEVEVGPRIGEELSNSMGWLWYEIAQLADDPAINSIAAGTVRDATHQPLNG